MAIVVMGAPTSAHAQSAPEPTEESPPRAQDSQAPARERQAQTPPAKARGGAFGLPPADQAVLKRIPQPVFSIEAGGGVVGFVGGTGAPGPGWNVRITGAMSDRFAIEGNYLGSVNERTDTKDTLVMTAIDAGLRYNILLPEEFFVQPFVVGGAGYAGFAGRNGDPAMLVVPLVLGAERLLTPNIKVGARFSYRPAFFDDLSTPSTPRGDTPGADTWTLLAQIGGGF